MRCPFHSTKSPVKILAGFFVSAKVLPLQEMGYLSTLITDHYPNELPAWFAEKYSKYITVIDGTLLASKKEFKIYDNDIFEDLQKALIECGFFEPKGGPDLHCAVLHEDGLISKVVIGSESIEYYYMDQGMELETVWTQ